MNHPVHPPSSDLTDLLIANNALRPGDPLTDAFRRVDRGMFVPAFALYEHTPQGTRYRLVRRDNPDQHSEWASHIYADETLIIEIKGKPVIEALPDGTGRGRWTSSSTMPGLVAQMLTELDLTSDSRVLEIGVGSGYTAALLCQRLNSNQVTSIDISPRLVADAADRFAELDCAPVLATFDGHRGYPDNAPYDRLIATTAFTSIPTEWIAQVRAGGVILANIAGGTGGAMLKLHVQEDGTAEGRFLRQWAGFMPARSDIPRERVTVDDEGEGSTTTLDPAIVRELAFAFLAQLATIDANAVDRTADDGTDFLFLEGADGSWAEIDMEPVDGRFTVVEGGPRRLWAAIEEAHNWWTANGRPDWSQFGATVTVEHQYVWYGSPTSRQRWPLPA